LERRGDVDALGSIFVDLISQRADRNAENISRPCAIAQTVLQCFQDQGTLNVDDAASDERIYSRDGGLDGVHELSEAGD